jgi:hypothetical protein
MMNAKSNGNDDRSMDMVPTFFRYPLSGFTEIVRALVLCVCVRVCVCQCVSVVGAVIVHSFDVELSFSSIGKLDKICEIAVSNLNKFGDFWR